MSYASSLRFPGQARGLERSILGRQRPRLRYDAGFGFASRPSLTLFGKGGGTWEGRRLTFFRCEAEIFRCWAEILDVIWGGRSAGPCGPTLRCELPCPLLVALDPRP
eukprot:3543007-Rhodomonas_salina.1